MPSSFSPAIFQQALATGNIVWRKHTLTRMLERGISRVEVVEVLAQGELIQTYDYDRPFPSAL